MLDKVVFTGGTSLVFPLRGFLPTVSPAFSATTGADYQLTPRFWLQGNFAYNRHPFESRQLHPGINLQSNTELLSVCAGGRYMLLAGEARTFNPYVAAGAGFGILSQPSITVQPGSGELTIGSRSRNLALLTAGAGLDWNVSPTLVLYVEAAYFRAWSESRFDYVPVLVGVRTYPASLLRKE